MSIKNRIKYKKPIEDKKEEIKEDVKKFGEAK